MLRMRGNYERNTLNMSAITFHQVIKDAVDVNKSPRCSKI